MDIQQWFLIARDREIPELLDIPPGPQLNLGQGRRPIGAARPLDLEHGWDATTDPIPEQSETISGIWAHAFFDYLADPVKVLVECNRVLAPEGVINIVTPHGLSDLWAEDILRKTHFHEETWRNLLNNPWYDSQAGTKGILSLEVHTCFIMGVVWRNLSLFTQLVKPRD